jgi:hypothetical protein
VRGGLTADDAAGGEFPEGGFLARGTNSIFAAIVQNLRTLALWTLVPPPMRRRASFLPKVPPPSKSIGTVFSADALGQCVCSSGVPS